MIHYKLSIFFTINIFIHFTICTLKSSRDRQICSSYRDVRVPEYLSFRESTVFSHSPLFSAQDFYEKYFVEESGFSHPALDILLKLTSAAKGLTLTVSQIIFPAKGT